MNLNEVTIQTTEDGATQALKDCKQFGEAAVKIVNAYANNQDWHSDMINAWKEGSGISAVAAVVATDPRLYELAEEALNNSVHTICLALEGSSIRYMTDESAFRALTKEVCFMGTSHIIEEFHEATCIAAASVGVYNDNHTDTATEDAAKMALSENKARNRSKAERVSMSIDKAIACLDEIEWLTSELSNEIQATMEALKESPSMNESLLGSSICKEIRSTIKPAEVAYNMALSCATNHPQRGVNSQPIT